ncbi:MAG: RsmE family RNA methyltransferase [Pyrinomonadaceae bacterium]
MSVRRFFSDSIDEALGRAELSSDEAHHARDVLRLKTGDALSIFDGEGREFSGKLLSLTKSLGEVGDLHEIAPAAPASPLSITQASVVIPGEKFDLVVQKAVELGVMRFFRSHRCVARSSSKTSTRSLPVGDGSLLMPQTVRPLV